MVFRLPSVVIGFILFFVTAAVFWPACQNEFLDWDDNAYVYKQPAVLKGIRWEGLQWATTASVAGHWHPLTLVSFQLDAQLFGPGSVGFHRTAVLLHAINAALAYFALSALTGCRGRSAIVAVLFAMHPMRVESVAWISARKDLLSGFFFWLTLLAYARYVAAPSLRRYVNVAFCFLFGLSSKSMLVTTPCVLLLLDYWPLARWPAPLNSFSGSRRLIIEKLPLFALSVLVSIITVSSQQPAMSNLARVPLEFRFKNAVASYASYILQTCWPAGLSPFYAMHPIPDLQFYGSLMLLIVLTVLAVWQRQQRPYLLVGWLWFMGILVPVSGMTQVGLQARADRYTYLAQVGLFVAIVWFAADYVRGSRRGTIVLSTVTTASLIGFTMVTIQQISVWHDTESMWREAYRLDPDDYLVTRSSLIKCLFHEGKKVEALQLTNDSLLAADQSDYDRMLMLATLLSGQGQYESCVRVLDSILKQYPERIELLVQRGKAHAALGQWQSAVQDFRQATKLAPGFVSVQFHLAHALLKAGYSDESRRLFAAAIQQSPDWPQMAVNDAWQKSTSSEARERVEFWPVCLAEQAIEATREKRPQFLDVLAAAYANSGQFDDAVATAKLALQQADLARQEQLAAQIRARLSLYEKRRPFRQTSALPD